MEGPASETSEGGRERERSRYRAAALIAYFDTSAFLKLVVEEAWSGEAAAVWHSASRRVSSRLLYPEARAALAAAHRAGRLRSSGARNARAVFEQLWAAVEVVELTPQLAGRAGDLADRHSLRGYDAVHLASAEEVAGEDVVFVGSDAGLLGAVENAAIDVARLL